LNFADLECDSLITADVDNSTEFEVDGSELSELDVGGCVACGELSDEVPVEDTLAVFVALDVGFACVYSETVALISYSA